MSDKETPALDLVNGIARIIWYFLHLFKRFIFLAIFVHTVIDIRAWYYGWPVSPFDLVISVLLSLWIIERIVRGLVTK